MRTKYSAKYLAQSLRNGTMNRATFCYYWSRDVYKETAHWRRWEADK